MRVLAYKWRPERQTIRMDRVICTEPLELEYLFTYLEDHDVTLVDGMTDRRNPVKLARRLGCQVVLLSAHITNAQSARRIAARLKNLKNPPYVFVGGPTAEVTPEPFFHPAVDGVFSANSLEGVTEVLSRIERNQPFDDVPGAAFNQDGTFVANAGPPLDPAQLRMPKRVMLERNSHRYFYMYFARCASIKTAFGCHEKCIFCFCTKQQGGHYGPRPLLSVVEEIAGIPVDTVFILDDNFLSSRGRVLDFCRLITAAGIQKRYIIYGNADFVAKNPDVMKALKDIGVAAVITGFEFASDTALANVNKRARVVDNDRTIELCRELGIELFALFVVHPDWRNDDFRQLSSYIRSRGILHATFSTWTVFPGTELAKTTGHEGPPDDAWWRYDLLRLHERPRHLSRLRYYLWLFYLYILPSLGRASMRRMVKLYGRWGYMKLVFKSWLIGLEYLLKLFIWR